VQFINGFLGNDPNTIYNTHGHRCMEPSEVNTRNHFLVVGDNAGLSLDKPIEETFPYILSKKLNMSYYNLCVFNGGVDAIKLNLFSWLSKHESPKYIVIACEFLNSTLVSDSDFSFIVPSDLSDPITADLINNANHGTFFFGRNYLLENLINNTVSVPIFQLLWKEKTKLLSKGCTDVLCDSLTQQEIANLLYGKISDRTRAVLSI